jgi:hypothetical protein
VDDVDVREARLRLDAAGVSARDVILAGEPDAAPARQGAVVVRPGPSGYEVVAEEHGMAELLTRASTEDEALAYVVDRVTQPLPEARQYDATRLVAARSSMAGVVGKVRKTLEDQPGAVVNLRLWDGAVVDRFGPLDGVLLWPEGTPFAQRAQPPDALDRSFPDLGLVTLGVAADLPVLARLNPPWFGQPGGAVVFKLATPGQTVRDLVRTGELVRLTVTRGSAVREG